MGRKEAFLAEYQNLALTDLVLPDCLKAQYTPVSCLKSGEREVYLVKDRAGWPAVLKIQPSGREDPLRREYDLLRSLSHPQLPRPLAYWEGEGREYLVREYVEGISLYDQVTSHGPLSPRRAKAIILSLSLVLH